ncbi:MAG: tetratricopeptide repeat protein [Anaerolineae bacterium]|nr:tetratricopeptide repeat protein [Anaerolineae bacterium]
MIQCPYCGNLNPPQARFCMNCGHALLNAVLCTTCYTLLPPEARYCYHCGAPVLRPLTAAPVVSATSPQQIPSQQISPDAPTPQPLRPSIPSASPASPLPRSPAAATLLPPSSLAPSLPTPRPLKDMLPSLQRYLPPDIYEPLERRPTDRHFIQVRDHLSTLLTTVKTYLPLPVVLEPQPAGSPAGGMYRGVFLFGDVSGFTPLSEKFKALGQAGAERIMDIINMLFSELVTALFEHGGSLLKFGGDAMLGLFPTESDDEMMMGVLQACQAALAMQTIMQQDKFASIEVPGGTQALKIKCGISAGPYFAAHIGTKPRPELGRYGTMAYITTGHTVNMAEQAEGHAYPGEVAITREALELVADQIEIEPVTRQPDEHFSLVRWVPRAQLGSLARPALAEPPEGDIQAQITYLVERLNCLTAYLSAELISRIVTNHGDAHTITHITPEHRPVTVMFANYVGISDLIEDLGNSQPKLIIDQLNAYFVYMVEVVEKYEGMVARMDQYAVGDRLVIFFGAPFAHEDDPVRAVYTALEMQEAVRKNFSALQTPSGIYRFRQRIGINTGHLFAGNAGAPALRQEYTLMGDDINMAARLMSNAGWQQIYISKKTQEHVTAFFELKDLGKIKVKGKEILIHTFEVLERREEIGRTRGLDFGESPLTGRDEALQTLKTCTQELLRQRGQIVSVIGNSGLGKSRLTREMRDWLLNEAQSQDVNLLWLEGQSLSFSEQMTYWLAVQVFQGVLGLERDASSDDILFALWERGEDLLGKETAREAIPFLAHLIGLELEGEWAQWVAELDPSVRQKQTFWAAREFFSAAARRRPIVIALDDLHWADEASLSLVEDLLAVTDHVPLLFWLIFRARHDKGCWRLRDRAASAFLHRYTEVRLAPLSDTDSRELLSKLLPGATFDADTEREILDKAAGNPFYLEEVVRSLIDSGAVVPASQGGEWEVTGKIRHITVPGTLQAAIVARIDRLTEDARRALQMAAVIGRRFQVGMLRSLAKAEAQLDAWLAQLERSGLIRPVDTGPVSTGSEMAYAFPDALVQEVAYDSLLVQSRQQFHRQIGEILEESFVGKYEQACDLLAYHFHRSNDAQKAIIYLEMAGRVAQAKFANETAMQHYSDLLGRLGAESAIPTGNGAGGGWEKRFDILAQRQKIYGLWGQQTERYNDLTTMLSLAQTQGDAGRHSDALNILADFYYTTGRYTEAEGTAREALAIKMTLEDPAGQAAALNTIGVLNYVRGDYDEAREPLEKAVVLRQQANDAEGEAWSMMYLGMIDFMTGNYSDAARHHTHALEMARKRKDWYQESIHLTNAARVSHRMGQYELALQQFQEALEMKTRGGDRLGQGFTLHGIGMACTYLGDYPEAEQAFQQSLELRQQINDERGVSYSLHGLGLASLSQNQCARAQEYFRQALEIHTRLGLKTEIISDLSAMGQVYLCLGALDDALTVSEEALTLLVEQQNVGEIQQIYLNHYRVLAARADPETETYLQKAYHAMVEQADRITDEEARRVFLEHVTVNQEIKRYMQQ